MTEDRAEIHIREATPDDAAAVAKVHVLSWKESFVGLVPDAFLERLTIENRTRAFAERFGELNYRMFVAELGDRGVVGFADAGDPRYDVGNYDAELDAMTAGKHEHTLLSNVINQLGSYIRIHLCRQPTGEARGGIHVVTSRRAAAMNLLTSARLMG